MKIWNLLSIKFHDANKVCFAGNFFTQSVSMQLQIELSYLGKECSGMYPLEQQIFDGRRIR